ncbi:hypothetical protein [Yersinia aldovae]|uniref:hypothetical protein n=1 Tax=Yersinia aldovae TaxID=29483 RepID=UPI000AC4EB47|nr:hypothetical protein [Yersinia aldovae]
MGNPSFLWQEVAIYSSVIEGATAPRGASMAYAITTPTARFPFIQLIQYVIA